MNATAARLLRIQPLTRAEVLARHSRLRLAPAPASEATAAATAATTTISPAMQAEAVETQAQAAARKRAAIVNTAQAIVRGDPAYAQALGSQGQRPDNLRIEPAERGKTLFWKVCTSCMAAKAGDGGRRGGNAGRRGGRRGLWLLAALEAAWRWRTAICRRCSDRMTATTR